MKKALVIILVFAVVLSSAVVFAYDIETTEQLYIEADSLLSSYIKNYSDLINNREDDIEKQENIKILYSSPFNTAQSKAAKEIALMQIDYNISNGLAEIQARQSKLAVDFRNDYYNLYSALLASTAAKTESLLARSEYSFMVQKKNSGFISNNELLKFEYQTMTAQNTSKLMERQYESTLRSFNFKIGLPLNTDDYTYNFKEPVGELKNLDFYISNALENSLSLKQLQQTLEKYYVEKKQYDVYSFSTNLNYITDTLRTLEINIRISELQLEKAKATLVESITSKYNSLLVDLGKINLSDLNIKILQHEYSINSALYNRGFIDKEDLSQSSAALEKAKQDHIMLIYRTNTQIKTLENDCAYYPKESDLS